MLIERDSEILDQTQALAQASDAIVVAIKT
jgi:hypothetical protein